MHRNQICNYYNLVIKTMTGIDLLTQQGIKPSLQRIAILDWLMEHPIHPTVEEIYAALAPSIPTLSKTTVYNTLKLFAKEGVARSLNLDEKLHFDANMMPHAHFICECCGKVQDIMILPEDFYIFPKAKGESGKDYLNIKQVEINYFGTCDLCKHQ